MRRYLHLGLTLIALFAISTSWSQTVKGVVVDSVTLEPLPFVNVSVPGSLQGTLTNNEGKFELDISQLKSTDSIKLSLLSYDKLTLPLSQVKDSAVYKLPSTFYTLNEVVVSPQPAEEYIREAIRRIPENSVKVPFNTKVYYRMIFKLNGKYMTYTEAFLNAYNVPVINETEDSTRLQLIAMRHMDEQEAAVKTVKLKKKKEKQAEIDTTLMEIAQSITEQGPYAILDSTLEKRWYYSDSEKVLGDYHFRFKNVLTHENRKLLNISYGDKKKEKNDKEQGYVYLEENSLAIESYRYGYNTVPGTIKAALLLFGYNMEEFKIDVKATSQPTDSGYIPEVAMMRFDVGVEKIKMFSSNVPIDLQIEAVVIVLDHEIPASNPYTDGIILKRGVAIHEQAEPNPDHPIFEEYKGLILPEGGAF